MGQFLFPQMWKHVVIVVRLISLRMSIRPPQKKKKLWWWSGRFGPETTATMDSLLDYVTAKRCGRHWQTLFSDLNMLWLWHVPIKFHAWIRPRVRYAMMMMMRAQVGHSFGSLHGVYTLCALFVPFVPYYVHWNLDSLGFLKVWSEGCVYFRWVESGCSDVHSSLLSKAALQESGYYRSSCTMRIARLVRATWVSHRPH